MRIRFVLLITCCFLLVTSETYAISKKKLNDRIERYNNYLEEVMEIPETAVPSKLLKSCKGILIMRQYKAGFIFGAKGGSGIALKREIKTGKWSAPHICR
jgi:lipid-binding SYLF domain-containing protein